MPVPMSMPIAEAKFQKSEKIWERHVIFRKSSSQQRIKPKFVTFQYRLESLVLVPFREYFQDL